MSHVTMDDYTAMQRIFKYIKTPNLEYQYSSYPVTISSTDDFFLINRNLVVTETSLSYAHIDSKALFESNYIPEYYKVVASCRLSKSAEDWIKNMKLYKGGIYNSQVFSNNFSGWCSIKKNSINKIKKTIKFLKTF